ncbi:MAG: hypothetical protein K5821_04410 [Nitrobacter sp.]|uniref:hypothetical protein n=1 Tax=Nitrobacter sp. TaxID=29420 RepID=UPI002639D056|nr:hypothetical protein [Nitrobacter sp.]MCV0385659.1 hypothetical protein [Nitrobacter sp.]
MRNLENSKNRVKVEPWFNYTRLSPVTVCIATICDSGKKIIVCSDTLISGPLGSAETMLKTRMVSGWTCQTAGDQADILSFLGILSPAMRRAKAQGGITESNIGILVRDSLAAAKKQKVDEVIKGQYAISYDDLLKIGKDRLPPEIFRDAMLEVRDTRLNAECIISGFADGFPMLLQTNSSGQVFVREDFAVVGEGAYLAQTILLHRAHSDVLPLARSLYTVYEAKKHAEGARSVGGYTSIGLLQSDSERELISFEGMMMLKEQYKKFGPQPIAEDLVCPDGTFRKISKVIEDIKHAAEGQTGGNKETDGGVGSNAPETAFENENWEQESGQDAAE